MDASEVERAGMFDLALYAKKTSPGIRLASTFNQEVLQMMTGDFLAKVEKNFVVAVEVKVEQEDRYGNLFLETWSNRSRWRRGWLDKCEADELWYYFLDEKELYICNIGNLKQWAFGSGDEAGRIYDFKEACQRKREQKNDTWGRCVPIDVLQAELSTFNGPIDVSPYLKKGE